MLRFLAALFLALMLSVGAVGAQETNVPATDAPPPTPALSELSDADIQTAFRRMKRNAGTIQFDLRTETVIERDPPGWVQALQNAIGKVIEFLMPFFKVFFWIIVGALGLLILYAGGLAMWEAYQSRRGKPQSGAPVPEYRPSAAHAEILLQDADALAAQGRYSEAVHLLLFRSIQDIERARPEAIRLSLTAREIGDSTALGPQTRAAFSALAAMVERSHFGTAELNEADFLGARQIYVDFSGLSELTLQTQKAAA